MTINHEDLNLDALEATARAADADWASDVPTMPLRRFHEATYPPVVLALIARLREAEAERERWASASDVHASRATTAEVALLEAEACIEKARKHLERTLGASAPMSTTHYILTAYKPTTENGSKS